MKKVSFKKAIESLGYTIVANTKGYNFRSAFARDTSGQLWYFSLEDLRDTEPGFMYRTAEHIKDYTGGSNQWDGKQRLAELGLGIQENRSGKDYNGN